MDYNLFIQMYVGGGGGGTMGLGGTLGGGGGLRWGLGGGVDVRSWSKLLFLVTFWKINTYWPPLDERVRSSFADEFCSFVKVLQRVIIYKILSIFLDFMYKNYSIILKIDYVV